MDVVDWIKTIGSIGGFAGIATLVWRVIDLFGAYLFIEISAETDRDVGLVKIKTVLENRSLKAKKVSAAFILISPYLDRVEDVFESLLGKRYEDDSDAVAHVANEMKSENFCLHGVHDNADHALIPLTYYTWENYDVGDERLSYEAVIKTTDLTQNKIYAARFYIHGEGRLHRVVQTSFDTIPKPAAQP
jgi:hypothetical protein